MSDSLKKIYVDDSGNIQFSDHILEEKFEDTERTDSLQREPTLRKNINKLAEKFMLEKFNNENNNVVNQWMELFERECERFELNENQDKIEALRLFLEGSCLDWYSSMLMKLTINSKWTSWKNG